MNRRTLLKLLGCGAAALPFRAVSAAAGAATNDFFIIVHAAGGWDVTLWSDPRNEAKGLVTPAATGNTDIARITRWKPAPGGSFEILAPTDTSLRFGPAIGDLFDLRHRLTIFNGIAMNTVSHEDGVLYSLTGRHKTGGSIPASSIDVVLASELGKSQLMPDVSIKFASRFVGSAVAGHAIPLRVGSVDEITKVFGRSNMYLDVDDRGDITALLAKEAETLGSDSTVPEFYDEIASQHRAVPQLIGGELGSAFDVRRLQSAYPEFNYRSGQGNVAVSAAFAVEALQRNIVRCIGFSLGGLDTHTSNYRQHAATLQDIFGTVATLVKLLDATPHPTIRSSKLSDHTHILVLSDFCRTPQINMAGGRDHYPNNSALVISPRFRGGQSFGGTDAEQLLPVETNLVAGEHRPLSPPDVLATFLDAFGIDPRRYMRDGAAIKGARA